MSKYDLMKNIAKKNSSKNTADSSKVSKPSQTATRYTDTGTGGQTKKITSNPQKSTATYWQATQQSANQQATKQKTVQRKTLTGSMKRQAQVAEKEKRTKYAEATRNAQKFDPNAQQDYSQFNAGIKALFSGRNVAGEMANYTNRNRKQIAQDMAGRQKQAGYAQSAVDKANADIASNDLTKTFSDLGMKGLGGMTSSVGGLIRGGSNLVQGFAGLTGNQDLARQALQFDRNLGTDEAIANINRNNTQANTFAGQIAESIGGMIPTIGANLVGGFAGVGEQAGLGLMGASVFGNSGSEAFNNLSEDGELSQIDALRALGYGGASAALEVGTEKLSDFIPGLDTFAFTNPDHLLGQAGGEALEEMISSALEPFINPLADQNVQNAQQYGEQIDANTWTREHWQDILESGLLGAGTSLAMGAPANVRNAVENRYIDSLAEYNRQNNAGIPETNDYTVSSQTADIPFDQFYSESLDTAPSPGEELEPTEATLTKRQQKAVADEYKTDEIKPVDTQEEVTPEPEYEIPEDYQPDMSDEDTISDGEYRATDETFSDDDIEYVPTGDTDVDAVGRLKAVGEADPSNTGRIVGAYNDGIADVVADLDSIPGDIKSEMLDDMQFMNGEEVTQGAEKLSETRGSGVSQEFITDESAQEYGSRVNQRSEDVTYQKTSFDKVTASAKAKFDQMGENSMYDDWMSREPKTNLLTRFRNGIGTDYDTAVFVAEGQYLANQIELRKSDIIKKADNINAQVESFTDSRGNTSYRLVDKNGNVLTGEQAEATVKDLTEATSRLDAIYRRLNNISHNAGLLLRQFWFKKMSPGAQIKAVQDNVNKINDELNKKFRRKMESGEISPVTLNENTVQDYLKAETPEQKAQLLDQMAEEIASQVPHTLAEKIDAFRYNNMLFNPLTFVRNTVGNAGQAQIAKAKDLVKYYIESMLKASGAVRYNNIDMSQAVDHDLYTHTEKTAGKTISSDFAEAKKSGNVKKYLKAQGYTGDALKDISRFKGQTYNLGMSNGVIKSRMDEILANTAKRAGYTVNNGTLVDRNGTAITDKAYRKLVNDSYNQAKKQWLSSDSLRSAKADGAGKGKAVKSQRQLFQKDGFDILNADHTSVAGMLDTSVSSDDAVRRAINEKLRKEVFSNNNIFGREQNWKSHVIDYFMNENWYTGDDGYLRRGYARAMSQALDAQGYTAEINDGQIQLKDRKGNLVDQSKADDVLRRLNESSMQEALENTYHDVNKLADALNQISRSSKTAKLILDALVPFTRTPMNITRRAIEYSPLGLAKSIAQVSQVKSGQISAETWLNNIAKGTTGAGALAIGWLLASMGLLRGTGDEKDENVTRYEKDHGVQDYSVQVGDWSATLDWAAPGIAPFLLGAVMQEITGQYEPREGENIAQSAWNLGGNYIENIGALFQPIADTTMLSGLMETLSAFGEDDPVREALSTATESYVRQFTPTLGSKIHGIFDPTKYSTYSDNFFERQLRASAINMRLLDYAISAATGEKFLQPQLDADGQPAQTQDYGLGMAGRAINNLLNPATVKQNTMTDTDDELLRLYKSTGNYGILARQQYYINNTKFTPEERSEFNQYYLPEYRKAAEEFVKSPAYKDMDDDERVSVLNAMSKHLKTEAGAKYLGKVVPNASESLTVRDKACDFAVSKGVTTAKYYQYMNTPFVKDKDGNTISNTRAMQIRAQMEADGIWDDIVKAINDGQFEAKDFNLTKPVVKWDTSQFTYNYDLMQNGSYTGKY